MDFIPQNYCQVHKIQLKESLNKATNGMIQVRGECEKCNKFVKWIPYSSSIIIKTLLNEEWEKTNGIR